MAFASTALQESDMAALLHVGLDAINLSYRRTHVSLVPNPDTWWMKLNNGLFTYVTLSVELKAAVQQLTTVANANIPEAVKIQCDLANKQRDTYINSIVRHKTEIYHFTDNMMNLNTYDNVEDALHSQTHIQDCLKAIVFEHRKLRQLKIVDSWVAELLPRAHSEVVESVETHADDGDGVSDDNENVEELEDDTQHADGDEEEEEANDDRRDASVSRTPQRVVEDDE